MPTPRPTQQTPQALVYRLLANIRNQFVPDLDDKAWYRDHYHFIQYYVVLWPARFMNGKGFTITPERYSQIMLSVLNEIKRHGATDNVRYWPGYLMTHPTRPLHMTAIFSSDRAYRYTLWRKVPVTFCFEQRPWGRGRIVQFIGINPSIADETEDDNTVRRCRNFASAWGFSSMCMTNLFALVSTHKKAMLRHHDPIGPENDYWLQSVASEASLVVACWGVDGDHLGRASAVLKIIPVLHCLRHTKHGHPEHPLYLPKTLEPIPWSPPSQT